MKATVAHHLRLAAICFLRMPEGKKYGLVERKGKESALEA